MRARLPPFSAGFSFCLVLFTYTLHVSFFSVPENKYSSFQRQLNLYGFRKLVRGNEAGGYMHPLFERGKPGQLNQVRRGHFPEVCVYVQSTLKAQTSEPRAGNEAVLL